ncbi:MAG: FHA domain-containing protein [Acidobacteriota bacterium]|nr:FHA domain-containing protein [Acidobacteriota bacterium]
MADNFSFYHLMAEDYKKKASKNISPDWLVSGVLTKLGETFDRLTGRNWKPSSSLATSQLSEKLKKLLDAEVKDLGDKGQFVPHNIKLKMQWDKFSTDADSALKKLEYELLTAAIDHINDKRYHTYAPLKLEIKPDYFTEGVKLLASFDKFADEDEREAAINVTVPDLKNVILNAPEEIRLEPDKEIFIAEFEINDKPKRVELVFSEKQRLSVGRTKENDLVIDDQSISKIHAALVLSLDKQLMVADTGSTNGTYINGQRIAYGRAFPVKVGDKINFGTIAVTFEHIPKLYEEIADGEFETHQDFITKRVFAEEHLSTPTMVFPKEEVSTPDIYKTKPDYSTKKDIFQKEENLIEKKEIEPKRDFPVAEKLQAEEGVPSTNKDIVLDFGEKK